jgi:hypothetical protein
MALPVISTPEFTTIVPSLGKKVKYRPFLVKEEKILLMAMEGRDDEEITNSIQKILSSCILDDSIDVSKLATFDIEYLFLKLRAKSVGEVVKLKVGHQDQEKCSHRTEVEVSIDDINVKGEISKGVVMLTDDIGIKMHYPTISDLKGLGQDTDSLYKILLRCVDQIFDRDQVYSDFSEKDLSDWIDNLDQKQFAKLSDHFKNMPKLEHDIKWTCKECGQEETIKLEGLQSFFTLL